MVVKVIKIKSVIMPQAEVAFDNNIYINDKYVCPTKFVVWLPSLLYCF